MKFLIVFLVAIVVCFAAASQPIFTSDSIKQNSLWKNFKRVHGKKYGSSSEEQKRFSIFLENLKTIDERNAAEVAAGNSASNVHGITKFSDLTQEEFESRYLSAQPNKRNANRLVGKPVSTNVTEEVVDWSGILTTPVKDQGYCGSCWAFSATEQIESDAIRTLGVTYILSPEQIVQCDTVDSGCRGGWTETAYEYVKLAGGLETEAAYPYTSYRGITGQCDATRPLNVVTVEQYYTLDSETDMAAYVQSTGPLSVCLDASSWNSYTVGIMSVCGKTVDHCVQAVGVYPAADGGYWKVRNSWGYAWGEAGYIRLSYGSNTCAITRDPTYTSVSLVKDE